MFCMQVGSETNTFGIKGVQEHCMFFKTIEDANKLRRRISECFERAALPNVSGGTEPGWVAWSARDSDSGHPYKQ